MFCRASSRILCQFSFWISLSWASLRHKEKAGVQHAFENLPWKTEWRTIFKVKSRELTSIYMHSIYKMVHTDFNVCSFILPKPSNGQLPTNPHILICKYIGLVLKTQLGCKTKHRVPPIRSLMDAVLYIQTFHVSKLLLSCHCKENNIHRKVFIFDAYIDTVVHTTALGPTTCICSLAKYRHS